MNKIVRDEKAKVANYNISKFEMVNSQEDNKMLQLIDT